MPALPALGAASATTMIGNVPFTPASALVAQETERKAAEAHVSAVVVDGLSHYISTCWSKAKEAKQTIEQQMMKNLRQRNGEYEIEQHQAISEMGGSDVYVLLTATKCRAAEAWLNDLLRPIGERPWSIKPTPLPDLPPDVMASLKAEVEAVSGEVIAKAQQLGAEISPPELAKELSEYESRRNDEILEEIQEEAALRSERMSQLIDDQLQEGGWHKAFWGVISDLVTLKAGILKGPVLRKRKVPKYEQDARGKWAIVAVDEIIPEFARVSPFDLYPAPDSRHPDDGYLIERHQLSRTEIQAMIGVPGYSTENIKLVLKDYSNGLKTTLSIDSERAPLEFGGNYTHLTSGEKIEALEFWGSVQGKYLIEWGLKSGIDPELDYEINCWKIGNYVIRAILNPDKLGRKPYSIDSYERIPGSFWGRGVPELMEDNQTVCNAVARSIVNNAQIASGPLVELNIERCAEENPTVHPWKIFEVTSSQMNEAPVVRFYQPQVIVEPLMKVFDFFSTLSEDSTGIPKWAYGSATGGETTSSGLSMRMTAASRGIKEVVSHVDEITKGCIERTYDYNMIYSERDDVKGDATIVARGSNALLAKEQRIARTNEFLRDTNNPTDNQIIGLEGRAKLLKEAAAGLEIDTTEIIPDKDGLKALVAKIEAQQAALMAQGQNPGAPGGSVPGEAPVTLDPAGNPAGGTDSNLFMNQPGNSTNGN